MVLYEFKRYTAVVEGVCDAVGKAADDEQRDCEQKGDVMLFAGEGHCCGHHETAWNAEKAAAKRSPLKP